jgi:hypothetical protein
MSGPQKIKTLTVVTKDINWVNDDAEDAGAYQNHLSPSDKPARAPPSLLGQ